MPENILEFLRLVGTLKHVKRTGWVLREVEEPESIAGHMYRMAMMSFLLDSKDGLDRTKCMKLALVHDLAESIVGDITPVCGISRQEKAQRENEAMIELASLAGPAGRELLQLFQEYEAQESPEAQAVKDLDVFDMILQAFEYEKQEKAPFRLQEFFDSAARRPFRNPSVQALVDKLQAERGVFIDTASPPDLADPITPLPAHSTQL